MKYKVFLFLLSIILYYETIPTLSQSIDNLEKGKQLLQDGKTEQAKKLFLAIIANEPQNSEAHYYLGKTYIRLNELEKAIKHLEKAVSLRDTSVDYHLIYGNALFMLAGRGSKFKLLGRLKKGRNEFKRVIELDPQNIPARYSLMQYYLQAPGFLGGDKQRAQQLTEEMNSIDPQNILAISAKIQLLIKQQKLNTARTKLKESIAFCKTKNDSFQLGAMYNFLGYSYLKEKDCANAIQSFKSYIALAPTSANAYDSLGDAYYECGDLQTAADKYKKALTIKPDFKHSQKMLKKVKKELNKQ